MKSTSTPTPIPSCCPCTGKFGDGIAKSFATILNSDLPLLRLKASPYRGQRLGKFQRQLPLVFNPMTEWGFFLSSVRRQGNCGACWAMATAKALSDRYSLLTMGGLLEDFSAYSMVACEGTIFPAIHLDAEAIKKINLDAHTAGACNGNTLSNAIDYLYCVGCVTTACINQGLFAEYNIPELSTIQDSTSVPVCTNMLGPKYETCLDRTRAARYYRVISGYEVENDIEAIKQEIYKWGPVVAGMRMFDNFTKAYDGISIYMGPTPTSKSLGGHAVEICGWGREGDVDFWWICNSWGSDWGMSGYFRMKMMIPEVELEQNVFAFIPDFPGFTTDMIDYDVKMRPELSKLRKFMGIDPVTGYQFVTIPQIKNGKLKGDLQPIFSSELPNMNKVWLGDINTNSLRLATSFTAFQRPRLRLVYDVSVWTIVGGIVFCVVMYALAKYFSRSSLKVT